MGWFLKNPKKAKANKKAKGPTWWSRIRGIDLQAVQFWAAIVVLVAVGLGWVVGRSYLIEYARQHAAIDVNEDTVVLVDQPNWVSEGLALQLRSLAAVYIDDDPMDVTGLQHAADALRQSAWVKAVGAVERGHDGEVRLTLDLRQPMAVVEGKHGYHLVDHEGVRLPGLYLSHQLELLGMPVIVGVKSAPGAEGYMWPGRDLQAGLSLVRLIGPQPYFGQVRAVDVSERDGQGRVRLSLRTEHGLVMWGLPPGEEGAAEPAAEQKLHALAEVYRQRGSIDAGGRIVEVYGPAVYARHPDFAPAQRVGLN